MSARIEYLASEKNHKEFDLLLRGFQISRILRLVADLGIADKVEPARSVAISDLAQASSVLPDQLIRVLRALAAFGVFHVTPDGLVSHTSKSRLLRFDCPNTMHHCARFWTAPGAWKAWGMLDVAMTGGSPYESAWGASRFAYLRGHLEEARTFDAMMATFPDNRHSPPFSRCARALIRASRSNCEFDARRPHEWTYCRGGRQFFGGGADGL
jgi:hypothetical protein